MDRPFFTFFESLNQNLAVPPGLEFNFVLPTVCHSVATQWAINRVAPPALSKGHSLSKFVKFDMKKTLFFGQKKGP